MSIEYFAYEIPGSLIERLNRNSAIFFELFWEAGSEDFEEFQEYAEAGGIDSKRSCNCTAKNNR
jgi:hypothetical protein